LNLIGLCAGAQTQPFGTIDVSDLKMTSCDFEKGAHAEVLFDAADIYYDDRGAAMDQHKRVKIFNEKANREAIMFILTRLNLYH
jgi:hypothetical protein